MSRRKAGRRERRGEDGIAGAGRSGATRGADAPGHRLLALLAVLVPLLFFLPTTRYGFLLDDYVLFQKSASLDDLGSLAKGFTTDVGALRKGAEAPLGSYYRPVFLAASTLYYQLVGGRPGPWHLAAVLLAAAIGGLAWSLLRRVGLPPWHALLGSLVFSLHPSHVSSVAWASGIQELLATLFVLLALAALLARPGAASDRRALGLAALAFALALLSKEVAIGLLPLAGIWALLRRDAAPEGARRFARATALFAGVTAAYLAARLGALGGLANPWPHAPGLAASLPSVPVALLAYLEMLLWPVGFAIFRPERPVWGPLDLPVVAATGALLAVAAVAFVALRRRRDLALPLAWFVVWLLPVLNFWTLDPQWMVSDRYLFLPALALPWLLARLVPERSVAPVLVAVAVVCALLSLRYLRIFADERSFVAAMETAEPTSPLVFAEKARQLQRDGRLAAAEEALRRAVALDPRAARNLRALGDLELGRGELAAAEEHYRRALAEEPKASRSFKQLAIALAQAGRREQALALLEESSTIWPEEFQVQLLRAALLAERGERAAAESAYGAAARLRPDDPALAGGLDAAVERLAPVLATRR